MTNLIKNKINGIISPIVHSYTEKYDIIKNKLTERTNLFGDFDNEIS